jgi:CheY-like chemotaxis protein
MKRVLEGASQAGTQRRLLLYVEDEPLNFELTEFRLRRDYELLWARTDLEAIELVRTRGQQLYAVLMDVQLANSAINGLEICKLVRGLPLDNAPLFARGCPQLKCPILVVTAGGGKYTLGDVEACGASELITKPVDFVKLNLALSRANAVSAVQSLGLRAVAS